MSRPRVTSAAGEIINAQNKYMPLFVEVARATRNAKGSSTNTFAQNKYDRLGCLVTFGSGFSVCFGSSFIPHIEPWQSISTKPNPPLRHSELDSESAPSRLKPLPPLDQN